MKKRIISFALVLLLLIGLIPMSSMTLFAAESHEGEVRVIVSNDTYSVDDGAPWEGTLVDEWVQIDDDSTMMSCVVAALENKGYEQSGAENNYISTINGLSEFDGGGFSGWMGTLNDWFTNEGFGAFTVANGNLKAGDEIWIQYTCGFGEDLGGSWNNTDKSLKDLTVSEGSLSPAFSPDTHAYKLTLDEDVSDIIVTPTATNKNYQVRTSVGDKEYQRTAAIPVSDGTVITVKCGDKSWPTMNENGGDAQIYTLTVSAAAPAVKGYLSDLYFSEKNLKTTASKAKLVMTPAFDQDKFEYTVTVPAAQSKLYYFPTLSTEGKGKTINAVYTSTSGEGKEVKATSGAAAGGNLANCVAANTDVGNDVSVVVGDQTYLIHLVRPIALTGMSIDAGAFDVTMEPKAFKADTLAYSATIPADVEPVLTFSGMSSNYLRYSADGGKTWIDLPGGGGQTAAISDDVETVLCQVTDKTADWTKAVTYSVKFERMSARLEDVTLLGAESAAGFYPAFSKENKEYYLVWKENMNKAVNFTIPLNASVQFDGETVVPDDGVLTVNFDVSKKSQTLVLTADGLSLTYTFHNIVAGENAPDAVVDYLVINSQYTNSVNNAFGNFGLNPEVTLAATDGSSAVGTSVKSLGNFGGYITYYYEDPIQDDPRNKYGMDFYVYGNANKDMTTGKGNGFFEPGQVWVSEDGKTWYALAGSAHYEPDVDWNYTVTYTKTADGKTAWTDNHGNDQSKAAGVGAWPLAANYYMNDLSKSDTIALSGICLPTEKGDLVSNTDLPCVAAWGYADMLPNGTLGADVNPYVDNSDYSSEANGFDLKWAVDTDGLPVIVNNVHYIKVQTATNIWIPGVNEKSTEVQQVLRTVPQSASVGTTALPTGITVSDGSESVAVELKEGQNVYDVSCGDMTEVSVKVEAGQDDHVFINNRFASAGTTDEKFTVSDTARLVRVIVQNGDSEPSIVLLKLKNTKQETHRNYETVLQETLTQLAQNVPAPAFGTTGGEWSVISLARGGYYPVGDQYFEDYYARVAEAVPGLEQKAVSGGKAAGALDKNKSTENSRLIMALTAIGKDPSNVGGVNVLGAYDTNGFDWIKKQGINGPIFALIALDTRNFSTVSVSDDGKTLRQQCVDFILSKELAGGGWALSGATADPDITSMALQALAKYQDDKNVTAAAGRAINALSAMQNENGGFSSWGAVNSESIAQVITALSAWGIDADNDSRFVKDGGSALDALLTFYIPEGKGFAHVLTSGGGYTGGEVNGMATDQASYALVAYDRFVNGKTALYDMSDVKTGSEGEIPTEPDKLAAALVIPEKIENKEGAAFNGIVYVNGFPKDYRLMDCVISVPEGIEVTDVTMGERIGGGEVSWYFEEATGNLRIVYFDAQEGNVMTMAGDEFPAELMTIGFRLKNKMDANSISVAINSLSFKQTSDSETQLSVSTEEPIVIPGQSGTGTGTGSGTGTGTGTGTADLVEGPAFTAMVLYTGDDIDLIPSSKSAIAVAVTGIEKGAQLRYDDGTDKITMIYNAAASEKSGVSTYVAMISSGKPLDGFSKDTNYQIGTEKEKGEELVFGDTNQDGYINAQDALNSVNLWLRKSSAPDDRGILTVNVTGDSRINTFDALGIVENFVDGNEFAIVKKAAGVHSTAE